MASDLSPKTEAKTTPNVRETAIHNQRLGEKRIQISSISTVSPSGGASGTEKPFSIRYSVFFYAPLGRCPDLRPEYGRYRVGKSVQSMTVQYRRVFRRKAVDVLGSVSRFCHSFCSGNVSSLSGWCQRESLNQRPGNADKKEKP